MLILFILLCISKELMIGVHVINRLFYPTIGVYPQNAENHKYIDFRYVGGGQNPKSDPVHRGSLQLIALLPNGVYDYRYL